MSNIHYMSILFLTGCSPQYTTSTANNTTTATTSVTTGVSTGTPTETTGTTPWTETHSTITTTTTTTIETTTSTTETGTPPVSAVDYRLGGAHSFSSDSGNVSVGSCNISYERFDPDTPVTDAVVVLSHGFARGTAQMTGWAEDLAGWGFTVITPTLCHSSLWDTDHEQNGTDIKQMAANLGFNSVIYAGHSAGGLSSVIAGNEDPHAIGVIGLDVTDVEPKGTTAAAGLTVPFYGLFGESSDCNSNNNGIAVGYMASDAEMLHVTEADHCDFENETDWLCTTFCTGTNNTFTDDAIHRTVSGLLAAAAHAIVGLDDAQEHWWTSGGVYYDALLSTGAVSVP